MALTKRQCDGAEPQEHEYTLWDTDPAGFGLRVWPAGRKVFVVKYRVAGRQRKLTLGTYGAVTLDEARKRAKAALAAAAAGSDPATEKTDARHAPTMKMLCDRFVAEHVDVHLKPKTARPYKRLIADRIVKHFGLIKVEAVTRADVAKWHHGMKDTPVEANRALLLLHKVLNMAKVYGWHEGENPAAGVQKYRETARKRYLSGAELYRIGTAITELETAAKRPLSPFLALFFRLLLLTGMRRDEVLTLRWEDVDVDASVIRLKDSKTGSKTVVLSAAAVDVLKRAIHETGSPWVVTSNTRDHAGAWRHVTNPAKAWQAVKERASTKVDNLPDVDVRDVTLHDLRHSFASVGAGGGLSLPLIGALLGHADQASTQRYAHLAVDPLKAAADRIGAEIEAAMKGTAPAEVLQLKTAAGFDN